MAPTLRPAFIAGLFLTLLSSGAAAHPPPPVPETVSPEARAFLAGATPFDIGEPGSAEEWAALRASIEQSFGALDSLGRRFDFTIEETRFGEVPADLFSISGVGPEAPVLLHFHGGAYVVGSPRTDAGIIVPLAAAVGARVVAPRYRLAPEHPFPAALEDGLAVYRALTKNQHAGAIALTGSSAGAALAVSVALAAADEGLPTPSALGLISPWADLTKTGDSYRALEGIAPVLDYELTLETAARSYAGTADLRGPLLSPVYADFDPGFPLTLIQVGTRDLFLSNCARLQRRMRDGGAAAELTLWEGMWHAFQINPDLPESRAAIAEMAAFLAPLLEAR